MLTGLPWIFWVKKQDPLADFHFTIFTLLWINHRLAHLLVGGAALFLPLYPADHLMYHDILNLTNFLPPPPNVSKSLTTPSFVEGNKPWPRNTQRRMS